MNRKVLIWSVFGALFVVSGLIIFAMLSLSDFQDPESEKLIVGPSKILDGKSKEVLEKKIVPNNLNDSEHTTNSFGIISNNTKKIANNLEKNPDDYEDIAEGPANLADHPEGTEFPQYQIGEEVVDCDMSIQKTSGSISCWMSHLFNGHKVEEPFLSKPIYKYCMYGWGVDGQVWLAGCGYHEESFATFEEKFAKNPENTMILIAEHYTFAKTTYNETVFNFICRTEGCNIPDTIPNLLEHNMNRNLSMHALSFPDCRRLCPPAHRRLGRRRLPALDHKMLETDNEVTKNMTIEQIMEVVIAAVQESRMASKGSDGVLSWEAEDF